MHLDNSKRDDPFSYGYGYIGMHVQYFVKVLLKIGYRRTATNRSLNESHGFYVKNNFLVRLCLMNIAEIIDHDVYIYRVKTQEKSNFFGLIELSGF